MSFKKEGKVLIYNTITFSSSSEEEYPDGTSGRGGGLFLKPYFFVSPNLFISNSLLN
jgi:hypothetical protein